MELIEVSAHSLLIERQDSIVENHGSKETVHDMAIRRRGRGRM